LYCALKAFFKGRSLRVRLNEHEHEHDPILFSTTQDEVNTELSYFNAADRGRIHEPCG
jgi:hypothetical protein